MPYRIDILCPAADALDRLVELGALDVETVDSGLAALMPDSVAVDDVGRLLQSDVSVSPAKAREDGSVWSLSQRSVQAGRLQIVPADVLLPGAIRLRDSDVFGTGMHATTALCLEALDAMRDAALPETMLDIGTGSGVLALAALSIGVPRAVGIDTDPDALRVAMDNAQLNDMTGRLRFACGGPEAVTGLWPLVCANIQAAPLMEMASVISRRVVSGGRLVLSGIPDSAGDEVARAYQHLGMGLAYSTHRAGWSALILGMP